MSAAGQEPSDLSDDSTDEEELEIYTPWQMLVAGLSALGWNDHRINRVQYVTNLERFTTEYGLNPHACCQLYEDLQTTKINGEFLIEPKRRNIRDFFMTLHFLYRYPTEAERNNRWKISENTVRKTCWYFVEKIQALKAIKIGWPSDNFGDDVWVMTVDGTHFRTEEPSHPELPKDTSYFSFKHHCAGFNYELGVALRESKLVWMNGPYEAGKYNDIKIFREEGLKAKLQSTGKMAIGDHGYRGYPKLLSFANSHDTEEVRKFKSRARLRQEKYNALLKCFECLNSRFRHSKEKLQACLEAVAVLVQYKMEFGEPLYDI